MSDPIEPPSCCLTVSLLKFYYLIMKILTICLILFFSTSALAQISGPPVVDAAADSLYFNNRWKEAIPLYVSAIQSGRNSPILFYRLGLCYQQTGAPDKAIPNYRTCLAQSPNPNLARVAQVNLAKSYSQINQLDSVTTTLKLALKNGYVNINDLEQAPEYDNYRKSSTYPEIKAEMYKAAYPCMTEAEARWFDFWVGDWKAYVTGSTNQAGISKIEKIAGDCAILENWTSTAGTFNGKSINFYNKQTQKWEQHWVGSAGGYQKFINGEYKDDAMRFTFNRINADKTISIGRFTFFNQGPDQVRQFSESSNDEGKTWNVDYDFTYIRNKEKM